MSEWKEPPATAVPDAGSPPVLDGSKVAELYGVATDVPALWNTLVSDQHCPFLQHRCLKNRKSEPEITIGTCTMRFGRTAQPIVICPFRLLERRQVFQDCTHLLPLHEPGNELRIVAELSVPGGSVDYCLVSVRDGKPRDFVGIELQTMDTTGTVWPERQRFLQAQGVPVRNEDAGNNRPFGMNWKMTAKTTLLQLHHKVATFEQIGKHLVLVLQSPLLGYMRRAFAFNHIQGVRTGDALHFHSYDLRYPADNVSGKGIGYRLQLQERVSTDTNGVATCLGLQPTARVELEVLLNQIAAKLPASIPMTVGETTPVTARLDAAADD